MLISGTEYREQRIKGAKGGLYLPSSAPFLNTYKGHHKSPES